MKYTIHVGNTPIILEHEDFDSTINVDDLTKIDTSNIFGEAVTISAAANRIGLLKAEVEDTMSEAKLGLRIYEAEFKTNLRKAAFKNAGKYKVRVGNEDVEVKLTEKALENAHDLDPKWQKLKRAYIQSEKNFNQLTALYWSVQDKARKLNGLTNGTTPKEFVEGMIEGRVNGILISL